MRALLLLAVVPLTLTACSTDSDTPTTGEWTLEKGMGIDRTPVIYEGDAPDEAHHEAVVALHYRYGSSVYVEPFCTGTLIADDVILTAAHCLDEAYGGRTYDEMEPNEVAVYVGTDPASDLSDHIYTVSDVDIYSGYNRRALLNDIGLLTLSSSVTEADPVEALPASEALSSSDIGETINFAGFGYTETGGYGELFQVDLTLGGFGCSVSGCPSWGDDDDTQFSYRQDSGGPCSGDSGGPAFIDRDGTMYVAGITSWGDYYCTGYGVSTRVAAFSDYVDEYLGTADTGDGGSDEGYCGDGVCGDGESCDGYASGTESCSDDCDGRNYGPRRFRYCEVEGTCYGPGC